MNCLEGIHYLEENKLKSYLEVYETQVLYQKAGYLLEHFKDQMQLSDDFINFCKKKIEKSTRYLIKESNSETCYNSTWKLVVPESLFEITDPVDENIVEYPEQEVKFKKC